MYYSKSTNGFYDSTIHGTRTIKIADPTWVRNREDDLAAPLIDISNPDCKIPLDAVEITAADHAALLAGQSAGQRIVAGEDGLPELADPLPLTIEQRIASATAAVQIHLDSQARLLGYEDIKSAVSYADEPMVAKFQQEGRALRAWRSLVWAHYYSVLDAFKASGNQAFSVDDMIAGLPKIDLPA